MVDYYSILRTAVTAPEAGDAQWRRGIYDRARQMLTTRLKARKPPATMSELAAEQVALDKAITRIESELTARGDEIAIAPDQIERGPIAKSLQLSPTAWIVIAVLIAALGAGGMMMWSGKSSQKVAQPAAPAAAKAAATTEAKPAAAVTVATAKDGDLPAGVDGGSNDPDLSYVYRKQPTFYRTLQPVGTLIVDKLQHFLNLIQPNNVALRYGIGIGGACTELAGLRHIVSMAEWPQWQATQDMIERKLAKPGVVPGTPGNPLGARVLELDDGKSRINGTNAPKTIGTTVLFGCVRLANDDVVDLYNRVKSGTSVVVN
jgi:lipoprotein-anchoring transpeptidase ErfK/SrfK